MKQLLATTLMVLLVSAPAFAANIVIVNLDGPGEGFNDPTPATPVGGNPGTTIGQQRLNLFQHAATIWGNSLNSNVDIQVEARFNPQSCDSSSAVLGSAGPIEVERDFTGAELTGTWYHIALANKQAGVDLAPSTNDISTTFNSSIDNNDACLTGTNWYYGFDGNEGTDVELLPVLLHELAHGLGFSTLVNLGSGAEFFGFPDVYETYLLDTTNGLRWDNMSNGQRAASAINDGNVVWDGPATTAASPMFLGGTPTLFINSPMTLPGSFGVGTASFGPQVTLPGITGDLILVDDNVGVVTDACEPIQNGAAINGNIALIDRGACSFVSKVQAAQDQGATAVVIINNVAGGTLTLGGSGPGITIPAVSISLADGNAIKAELGGGVNVTVSLDTLQLAGADSFNRVKIYAPNPIRGGSSVSHWDPSTNPNLLMEPSITASVSGDVDLTITHFEDIGWFFGDPTDAPDAQLVRNALKPNWPNPFNPQTTIAFTLEAAGQASLDVFDVSGRRVTTLANAYYQAGSHQVTWNGMNQAGRAVVSGIYIYRLKVAGFEQTRRMLLLK